MSLQPANARELMRSVHEEEIEATVEVLAAAGIAHHVISTQSEAEGAEAAFLGQSSEPIADAVMVAEEDLDAARAALEKAYAESELPEGHFLCNATDAELAEVMLNTTEWSAFDVAHARRLAAERKLDLQQAAAEQQQNKQRLAQGKPAAQWLLAMAWLAILASIYTSYQWGNSWKTNLGCIFATILGETYASSCLEDDTTHVYDKGSRSHGRLLTVVAVLSVVVMRYVVTR